MLADTLNVPVRQAKLPQNVGNRRTAAPPALQNDDRACDKFRQVFRGQSLNVLALLLIIPLTATL